MNTTLPQRVVITAGAAGIGATLALRFHQAGARVAICDIDNDALAKFESEHPEIVTCYADVTDPDDMSAFFKKVEDAFGGVDVAIANAGTGGAAGAIETLTLTQWRACLSANLDGAFQLCNWAAGHMKAQKSGSMILLSSTAGLYGYPMRSPYATAKWGIIGLTKTLAGELGDFGVRVNAICPGAVEGERMERVLQKEAQARGCDVETMRAAYVTGVSMRSWVTADDIADTAMFLASPSASKISGLALPVDGNTETFSA